MHIRSYRPDDAPALWQVFHSAVHQLTKDDYSLQQRQAWAPDVPDRTGWQKRLDALAPYVEESSQGQALAYADLQSDGYIDHFFVAASASRQGAGRLLMQYIEQQAAQRGITQLSADVSLSAQPFFRHFGFMLVRQQTPVLRGVALSNAHMVKKIDLTHAPH